MGISFCLLRPSGGVSGFGPDVQIRSAWGCGFPDLGPLSLNHKPGPPKQIPYKPEENRNAEKSRNTLTEEPSPHCRPFMKGWLCPSEPENPPNPIP